MTDSSPIAWRAIAYGTPVLASDGAKVGSVREVLGSDAEDIFHGIRTNIGGGPNDDVLIFANDVTAITTDSIATDMTAAEALALPRYSEAATYHLASVGWLRKHVAWQRDSKSDKEPG